MSAPKPTIEEQIDALATLRAYARRVPLSDVGKGINTLDDADLFTDLDQERDAREARPVISTQSAMSGKIYRSDGSVLPPPASPDKE